MEPELIVFGTSSQVPTRHRNHNGYLVRWRDEGMLFDPGEDTSGQMARMGVSTCEVHRVFVTHFHGDHCLGLAGLFHRMAREGVSHTVHVHFPSYGRPFFERALHACDYGDSADVSVEPHPFDAEEVIFDDERFHVRTGRLSHSLETFGYRVEERASGIVLAFVMDTRSCRGALELAENADLLICEATYLDREVREARDRGHMTATHAAELARSARAKELFLTHFSQRYPNTKLHKKEAAAVFEPVHTARDLRRYPLPRRRSP